MQIIAKAVKLFTKFSHPINPASLGTSKEEELDLVLRDLRARLAEMKATVKDLEIRLQDISDLVQTHNLSKKGGPK